MLVSRVISNAIVIAMSLAEVMMPSTFAQTTAPTQRAVTPAAEPFPLSQVRLLDGPFKQRLDVNTQYLLAVEPDRLLAGFRTEAGLAAKAGRYGGWEARAIHGHSLGHYLSALSATYAATGEPALRDRVNYIVDELEQCQNANGDGYAAPMPKKLYLEIGVGKIKAMPFDLNGCWVPNYTLHKIFAGLRDAYRWCGSTKALAIERKLADWFDSVHANLNPEQIQEYLKTEHGGMNEVLADLSADTGDPRYLAMAEKYFHHRLVLDPLMRGEDKLDGLHGNTQIPKIVGLAREYELSGRPEYRIGVTTFFDSVVNRRSYAIGGHGEDEHFFPPQQFAKKLTPATAETCNTNNMLKLAGHLFAWEPNAATMDFVERGLINHILSNMGRRPGEYGYFLSLAPVGIKSFSTEWNSWWCCVGTGMENPPHYGELVYFKSADTLWINLFMASELHWPEKRMRVRQETRFPDEQTVRLTIVDCQEPAQLAMKIRIPYWCAQPQVRVNGQVVAVDARPMTYFTIDRTWRRGDTVELDLPMTLHTESLPATDGRMFALMFGPSVLAGIVPIDGDAPNPAARHEERPVVHTNRPRPGLVATDADQVASRISPIVGRFGEFRSHGLIRPNDLTFIPLYRVYDENYAAYFSLMAEGEPEAQDAPRPASAPSK